MVKVRDHEHLLEDGNIDLDSWFTHLINEHHYDNIELIRHACILAQLAGEHTSTESGESCLQQGLAMAEILAELELDPEALAAAIVYESTQYTDLSVDDIREQLGDNVAKLVVGVERMSAIDLLQKNPFDRSHNQIDNIRKMLLAMVDDVRIVLIKLAERLRILRTVSQLSDTIKQTIATQVMQIYAPLANRLGVGQLKWEMEDLAFRYLQPQQYKDIAAGLKARRVDRDNYVTHIVDTLKKALEKADIHPAEVYGRAKHIHSIHRKMHRKKVDLSQIYDAIAVRVLVDTDEDCYCVLSIAHNLWRSIPEEFDDYISNPKQNGYRSLHTAVVGPENRNFEIQIRTHQMHSEAELGVAAHWRYKEGATTTKASHERKIEWLRELLSWQKEVSGQESSNTNTPVESEFFEDRIYVFTPESDIIDLPQGATPLDFAYLIHSEVGNRCRGAKVNDKLVQLTQPLKTGDQIEILTTKQGKPSRDWLNPHLGYVKTSRAKAKILHWFKQQHYEKNVDDGKLIMESELRKLALGQVNYDELAKSFNFKKGDDLLAALGRGDIRRTHILNKLSPEATNTPSAPETLTLKAPPPSDRSDFHVEGVGNLLTHMAKCCLPVPGDPIIGYITLGHGISIHRQDCPNILNIREAQHDRLLQVDWGSKLQQRYAVNIVIDAYHRHHLVHDVTTVLKQEQVNVLGLNSNLDKQDNITTIHLTLELEGVTGLSRLLDRIKQLPNIIDAKRVKA